PNGIPSGTKLGLGTRPLIVRLADLSRSDLTGGAVLDLRPERKDLASVAEYATPSAVRRGAVLGPGRGVREKFAKDLKPLLILRVAVRVEFGCDTVDVTLILVAGR